MLSVRQVEHELDEMPMKLEGITPEKRAVITGELAGLSAAFEEGEHSEEAKRFDYLLLRSWRSQRNTPSPSGCTSMSGSQLEVGRLQSTAAEVPLTGRMDSSDSHASLRRA